MPKLDNEGYEAFCIEYVKDFNITSAMMKIRKYKNEHSAATAGCRLLRNSDVSRRVKELLAERKDKVSVEAEHILMELAILAFSDVRNVCDWDDQLLTLKPSDRLPPAVSKSIKEVSCHFKNGEGIVKVRMHDKFPALEKLGKYLGLFTEKEKEAGRLEPNTGELATQLLSRLTNVLREKEKCPVSSSLLVSSPAPSLSGLLGDTIKEK